MFKKKKKIVCDRHNWRDDRYKCPNCEDADREALKKYGTSLIDQEMAQEMQRLMGTISSSQVAAAQNILIQSGSGQSLQISQGQSAGQALKLPDPYTITYPIDWSFQTGSSSSSGSQYYFPDFNPADTSNLKVEFKPEDFKELRIDGDECSVFQAWAAKIANKMIADKISKLPIILLKLNAPQTSSGQLFAYPSHTLVKADNIDDATYGAFLVKFPEKK